MNMLGSHVCVERMILPFLFSLLVFADICTSVSITIGLAKTVDVEEDALLTCSFTSSVGFPLAFWYKETGAGRNLIVQNIGAGFDVQPGWNRHSVPGNLSTKIVDLLISTAVVDDAGTYICRVLDPPGPEDEQSILLTVNSLPGRPILNGPLSVNGTVPFNLTCQSEYGSSPIMYDFSKDGIGIDSANGLVTVEYAIKDHEGNYTCQARNIFGSSLISEPLAINIPYYPPSNIDIDLVCLGNDWKFSCYSDPNPDNVNYTWSYDERTTYEQDILLENWRGGTLTCEACNRLDCTLTVQEYEICKADKGVPWWVIAVPVVVGVVVIGVIIFLVIWINKSQQEDVRRWARPVTIASGCVLIAVVVIVVVSLYLPRTDTRCCEPTE